MPISRTLRSSPICAAFVAAAAMVGLTTSCDTTRAPTASGLTTRHRIHLDASPYWPDEAPNLTTAADYEFNDSIPAGDGVEVGTSGWYIHANSAGNVTQATSEADAPVSPPNAGQWTFPVGFTGGNPGYLTYDDTVASKEVFFEFTYKTSSPFEDPGHSRELLEVWGNSVAYAVDLEPIAGGAHRLDVTRPAGTLTPNKTSSDATLGAWHTVELYIKYSSTDTSADGIVRWWLDGTLQGEDAAETMASDGGMYETRIESRWDGSGAKALQDEVWYDQIHMSRASSTWPNMPGSPYVVFRDEPFDTIPAPGWIDDHPTTGLMTIVQDPSAPLSPPKVLQFSYPVGFTASQAPDTYVTDWPTPRPTRMYAGFWWKANANWQGNVSNVNKLVFTYLDGNGGDVVLMCVGTPGGPYYLRFYSEMPSEPRSGNLDNLPNNKSTGQMVLGEWHKIEWQLEYGTPGTPTGTVRWWLDGTLVGEYSDVTFPATENIEEFQFSPTWGGVSGTKTQQDYFWFDHVILASAP